MEQSYLIDTNVVSKFLNGNLSEKLAVFIESGFVKIAIITRMELLSWKGFSKTELQIILKFINECEVVGLEEDIIVKAIEIRKKYNTKLPDAIIASSAIVEKCKLITLDNDFKNIKGLKLVS